MIRLKSLREQIKEECQRLDLRLVKINKPTSRVLTFFKKIKQKPRAYEIAINSAKDRANFIFFLNSLDFSLWIRPQNWLFGKEKGFFALEGRLLDFYKAFGFQAASFDKFKGLISPREPEILARQRYDIYQISLNWLERKFEGDIRHFLKQYQSNTITFVKKLSELPQYHDFYPQYNLHFYKKAQILYWDFYLHKFIKNESELKNLTVFPDYVLPAFWQSLDLLSYRPVLQKIILARKEIKSGSRIEIEIRSATVLLGEILSQEFGILPVQLDFCSWSLARGKKLNFHRTKTLFY